MAARKTDMDSEQATGRVKDLLVEVAGVDPVWITPDARLAELGVDSIAAVALLDRLEETFDVTIPPEDALHLTTVRAIVRYVSRHAT